MHALVVNNTNNNLTYQYEDIPLPPLKKEEVLVKIVYSSLNHKDLLAFKPNSGVVAQYPMVPGIDLSGIVLASKHANFKVGDQVLATGYQLGVAHFGGFATQAIVPGAWLHKVPTNLTLKTSMILGTAGLTAALAINKLLQEGMQPTASLLVTGATGGVGSIVLAILAQLGFTDITILIHQSMLDTKEFAKYNKLKMEDIDTKKLLAKQHFSFVIDCVGGAITGAVLKMIKYGGAMTVCGNIAGNTFNSSILPFILRGVTLFGIDSVAITKKQRNELWQLLATTWAFTPTFPVKELKFKDLQTFIDTHDTKLIGRTIITNS